VVTQSGKSLKNILKNPSDLEQLKSLLSGKKQQ
jgi:hypothetical protein